MLQNNVTLENDDLNIFVPKKQISWATMMICFSQ